MSKIFKFNGIFSTSIKVFFFTVMFLMYIGCEENPEENSGDLPEITTAEVSNITGTTAVCGGTISDDGGSDIIVCGVCWSTGQNPKVSDSKTEDSCGVGDFTSAITGLTVSTTYSVRAYATNSDGTGYGNVRSFTTTSDANIITDVDGNVYHAVTIGTQVWMVENLNVTHYRNGDAIPNVTDGAQWYGLTNGAYCNYGNDPNNATTYGRLYNWYAVTDSRGLAPTGWHVPSDAEWTTMVNLLGGRDYAGSKLKEAGNSHFIGYNTDATNETGFTALPGGYRAYGSTSNYYHLGYYAEFWTSTQFAGGGTAYNYEMNNGGTGCGRVLGSYKAGYSVRCIKDE